MWLPIVSISIDFGAGADIRDAMDLAEEFSERFKCPVTFEFNGKKIVVEKK